MSRINAYRLVNYTEYYEPKPNHVGRYTICPNGFNQTESKSCELLEHPEYNNLQHSKKQVRTN